jgi:hypothetical protein
VFCSKCGSAIAENSKFCNTCGTDLSTSRQTNELSENNLTTRTDTKKKNLFMILGLGLIIIAGVALTLNLLKFNNEIDLSVSLKSKDDFTFGPDCQPSKSSNSEIYVGLEVAYDDDIDADTGFTPLNGIWQKGDEDTCIFSGTLDKPDEASSYSIRFIAEKQNVDVAKDVAFQEGLDKIELFSEVGRTHKFQGKLVLFGNETPSSKLRCVLSWTSGGKDCGNIKAAGPAVCNGAGGFGDIAGGKTVKVLSEQDKELVLTSLGEGKMYFSDPSGPRATCTFLFEGELPRVKGSYRFIIGDRGEINNSLEEMEAKNWQVDFSLG